MICPTHLYGFPADLDSLKRICKKKFIWLRIAAKHQVQNIKEKSWKLGDFNIHSFHNKLIASGEGGMITTNNKNLAKRFEYLKNPPSVNRPKKMNGFKEISLNQRLSNLYAAVGLAQLERLEKNIKKRMLWQKFIIAFLKKLN